jgi:hypothetical protein
MEWDVATHKAGTDGRGGCRCAAGLELQRCVAHGPEKEHGRHYHDRASIIDHAHA